jgi:hypothetical protein
VTLLRNEFERLQATLQNSTDAKFGVSAEEVTSTAVEVLKNIEDTLREICLVNGLADGSGLSREKISKKGQKSTKRLFGFGSYLIECEAMKKHLSKTLMSRLHKVKDDRNQFAHGSGLLCKASRGLGYCVLGFELLEEVGLEAVQSPGAYNSAMASPSASVPAIAPALPSQPALKAFSGRTEAEEVKQDEGLGGLATNDPRTEEAVAYTDPYAEESTLEETAIAQDIRHCVQTITTVQGSLVCNDASMTKLYDSIEGSYSSEFESSVQEVLRTAAGPRVFTKKEIASIQTKTFSSSSTVIPAGLKWLVLTMNVLRILKPAWNEGMIFGIVSKEETFEMLKSQPVGTALIRFSDSTGGTLAVAFRDINTPQGAPKITHRQVGVFVQDSSGTHLFKILKVPRYANQTFESLEGVISCLPCTEAIRPYIQQ